ARVRARASSRPVGPRTRPRSRPQPIERLAGEGEPEARRPRGGVQIAIRPLSFLLAAKVDSVVVRGVTSRARAGGPASRPAESQSSGGIPGTSVVLPLGQAIAEVLP